MHLYSINKNNNNTYDISNANEEKTVEVVLVDIVHINVLGNYNEVNLHLAETTNLKHFLTKQEHLLKTMTLQSMTKYIPVQNKSEDLVEETHTWKKAIILMILFCPKYRKASCGGKEVLKLNIFQVKNLMTSTIMPFLL